MGPILLDTHVWAWSLTDTGSLSMPARDAIASAAAVYVSPVSFFEIGQKVRLGKWPTMEPVVPRLGDLLMEQGGLTAPLTAEILPRGQPPRLAAPRSVRPFAGDDL